MRSTRWPRGAVRGASSTLRWAGGCLATAAALTLTGCVPTPAEPAVTPSASASSSAPVFASDEEALAAATTAYGEYLAISDRILNEGGSESERISEYVSADYLEQAVRGLSDFETRGIRLVGSSSYDTASLQSHVENDGLTTVSIYVCLDVSATRILDPSQADVTPPDRNTRAPLEVEFQIPRATPARLLLAKSALWAGEDFCSSD
jgi:hypothetical protein